MTIRLPEVNFQDGVLTDDVLTAIFLTSGHLMDMTDKQPYYLLMPKLDLLLNDGAWATVSCFPLAALSVFLLGRKRERTARGATTTFMLEIA